MNERGEWSDVVSDVVEHIRRRDVAMEVAIERAKPRSGSPWLAVVSVALAVAVLWDVYSLTRPPDGLPPAEQEADLGWLVADAVELIESYREAEGRLPTAVELSDLLDGDVSYAARGDGYVMVAESDDIRVEYHSSVSIEDWLAALGPDTSEGDGS